MSNFGPPVLEIANYAQAVAGRGGEPILAGQCPIDEAELGRIGLQSTSEVGRSRIYPFTDATGTMELELTLEVLDERVGSIVQDLGVVVLDFGTMDNTMGFNNFGVTTRIGNGGDVENWAELAFAKPVDTAQYTYEDLPPQIQEFFRTLMPNVSEPEISFSSDRIAMIIDASRPSQEPHGLPVVEKAHITAVYDYLNRIVGLGSL